MRVRDRLGTTALLGACLLFAAPSHAGFTILAESVRALNAVAAVDVEGGIEDFQTGSAAPAPGDPDPFFRELELRASAPELGSASVTTLLDAGTIRSESDAYFVAFGCGRASLATEVSDPGTESFAQGFGESLFEFNFQVRDESEPFSLRFQLVSELLELRGAAADAMAPTAWLFLKDTLTDVEIVEVALADTLADGAALERQRRVHGLLPPSSYRLQVRAQAEGVVTADARGRGSAWFETTLFVPEPGGTLVLGVVGMGLMVLGVARRGRGPERVPANARSVSEPVQSRSIERRVRSSCSR